MTRLVRLMSLGVLAAVAAGNVAEAQYYAPPPGYAPAPPYYRPPPGYRCDATYRTPYGPRQHLVCDLPRPRPLGAGCNCPPPQPPPGYAPGPWLNGRTVE